MKLAISSVLALALAAGTASAAPEPWCGEGVADTFNVAMGNKFTYNSDADDLADDASFMRVVGASCSVMGHDNEQFHAQLAAARARWAKRLRMADADWADAAAWIQEPAGVRYSRTIHVPDHRAYSELGPIAQYALLSNEYVSAGIASYNADVLGAHLTETGRVGYVQSCLGGSIAAPAQWALCWADAEAIDLDKLAAELRSDKSYSGADRMFLRIAAYNLVTKLVPQRRDELAKADPAYRKLVEIAAKTRKDWSASPEALALVDALDDAVAKQSRSLHVDGCADNARAALLAQVAALPSTAFADMPLYPKKGDKDEEFRLAPTRLLATVAKTPDGYLAELAVVLCATDHDDATELATEVDRQIANSSGLRGPRTAALTAMKRSKIQPDARDEQISYPESRHAWVARGSGEHMWSTGVIKKLTRKGDVVHIVYDGKNVTATVCASWNDTNHVTAIRNDGTVQYQQVCGSYETLHGNDAPEPIDVSIADGGALKPGMVTLYTGGVMMAWAKRDDARPAVAFGLAIKK